MEEALHVCRLLGRFKNGKSAALPSSLVASAKMNRNRDNQIYKRL